MRCPYVAVFTIALLGMCWCAALPAQAEVYVGGQAGISIPQAFENATGESRLSVLPDNTKIGMKDSFLYGGKVGYVLPSSLALEWLGFEVDAYHTTPHLNHQNYTVDGAAAGQGVLLGITTVAFRVVIRDPTPTEEDLAKPQIGPFQRLKPYLGFGPALMFTHTSTGRGTDSNTFQGYSLQVGSRYYLSSHIAFFGEYKLDLATMEFKNVLGANAGLKGDYAAHNIAFGVSYHFGP